MTEERLKRREFLPLVLIVNCFKKPLLKIKMAFFCQLLGSKDLSFIIITTESS